MVDDNAINPETGETIYVGILEKLPEGFRWIYNLHTDDWLKIVRGLTSRAADDCPQGGSHVYKWDGTLPTEEMVECEKCGHRR